ncbi:unnamed protein product [Soboliphyme baturini]|uniref:MFS domain-containing protein n=1 Tax=Soboliphyme baturini TaxID=241478 RepID=A0A183IY17_9BILA|nr:unnamed protein product [Soboliphyme baturini]
MLGFFCNGVANVISAAVSADLGSQKQIQGNAHALSTVTGIVDGMGSIGAAIGQLIVPVIQTQFGWIPVFYLFITMIIKSCRIAQLQPNISSRIKGSGLVQRTSEVHLRDCWDVYP